MPGFGQYDCCVGPIVDTGVLCSESGDAPCIVEEGGSFRVVDVNGNLMLTPELENIHPRPFRVTHRTFTLPPCAWDETRFNVWNQQPPQKTISC